MIGFLPRIVELYRRPTGRTLDLFNEPGSETDQVENVSAVELLSGRDGAQTDAALELLSVLRMHVLQLF